MVPKRGVENTALVIFDGHEHRLVTTFLAEFFGLRRGSENFHVFGGPAQQGITFVRGVHPEIRQALGDGMVMAADGHEEIVEWSMGAAMTGLGIADLLALAVDVNIRPVLRIAPAPAPRPIILLYSGYSGKLLSAACTDTKPPPFFTYVSNARRVSSGHGAA